jgi:predicted PurR-regulated permease PerM
MPEERLVRFRPRAILVVLGIIVAAIVLIEVVQAARGVLIWIGVAVFLALALGLLVAILDLIPLAGATIAAIAVSTVAFLDSTQSGIIVLVFFVLYQQLENHVLQPVVYGRTVQLSPLAVLVAVLIGAELAGVIGALAAIPVAGTIQVIFVDWLEHRRAGPVSEPPEQPSPVV